LFNPNVIEVKTPKDRPLVNPLAALSITNPLQVSADVLSVGFSNAPVTAPAMLDSATFSPSGPLQQYIFAQGDTWADQLPEGKLRCHGYAECRQEVTDAASQHLHVATNR